MSLTNLEQIKRALSDHNWRWRPGKPVPYGEQLIVTDGTYEAVLTFYPKRGRSVIGGVESPLRTALSALIDAPAPQTTPTALPTAQLHTGRAEIGMDESGKGDWFGPVVVAAVYVTPAQVGALAALGVRDSKLVAASELPRLTRQIAQIIPDGARALTILSPEPYNLRYQETPNINLLLAALYAETVAPLQPERLRAPIVCDQFAQSTERLDTAFRRANVPRPIQLHGAEAASIAVATASILATAAFTTELERLGVAAGLGRALPKGASAIRMLEQAARTIIAREGVAGLARYAKLNFKPIQALLAG